MIQLRSPQLLDISAVAPESAADGPARSDRQIETPPAESFFQTKMCGLPLRHLLLSVEPHRVPFEGAWSGRSIGLCEPKF